MVNQDYMKTIKALKGSSCLIEKNLCFVVNQAYKVKRKTFTNVSIDDLVQEGNYGLVKAVDGFDPNKAKFLTYAAHWINKYMMASINDNKNCVRASNHRKGTAVKINKATKILNAKGIEYPTYKEIAEVITNEINKGNKHSLISEAVVKKTMSYNLVGTDASLDAKIKSEDGTKTFGETLQCENTKSPEEAAHAQDINDLVHNLSGTKKDIIIMKFFDKMTDKQIKNILNIATKEYNAICQEAYTVLRKTLAHAV